MGAAAGISLLPGALGHLECVLTVVGLLYLGKVVLHCVWVVGNGVRAHFWSRLWEKRLVDDYGRWAVVTGSSDGIGKDYAKELAKRGMNIVLISRTLDKLLKVSSEIVQEYGVETEVVQVDFSDGRPIYETIWKHLQDKEVGILVNNVGVNLPQPMQFGQASDSDIWSHVNVNMASVPAMTKLVLPGMLERGRGAIVNVASLTATYPNPLIGIYGATKAFVDSFSQTLEWEYRGSGITVQTLTPATVQTNMTSFSEILRKDSVFNPTSSTFAYNAVNTLGYSRRSTGYWGHGIQIYLLKNFASQWMYMLGLDLFIRYLLKHRTKSQV